MPTTYDIGDRLRIAASFVDEDDDPTDPTTVTCKVCTPAGTTTTYTGGQITHDGPGEYSLLVDITEAGTWSYRWVGTGTVVAAEDAQFTVEASLLA